MTKSTFHLLFACYLLFVGCNQLSPDLAVDQPDEVIVYKGWYEQSLHGYGIDAVIMVPPQYYSSLEMHWNENFGRLEISMGRSIDFFISEAHETVLGKKFEVESGILRIEYLKETDNLLYYKASLPDGSLPYFHFFRVFGSGKKKIQIENNPLIEFSQKEVELMLDIANSPSL
jgi:hypothetical protein